MLEVVGRLKESYGSWTKPTSRNCPLQKNLFCQNGNVPNVINFFLSLSLVCVSCSYVVNMGLIDKLYGCFLSVQGPVDEHPKMSAFLQQASALLHSMCKLCFVVTGR